MEFREFKMDKFYEELKIIKFHFHNQPDREVRRSRIKDPCRDYYLKTVKLFEKLLRKRGEKIRKLNQSPIQI
jgi:hypothetical protein